MNNGVSKVKCGIGNGIKRSEHKTRNWLDHGVGGQRA